MYKYEIKETILNSINQQKLFDDYFPEKSNKIKDFLNKNRITYFINAVENNIIIGTMGIVKLDEEHDGEKNNNTYGFIHLVVNEKHTGQGVATGIIRMAVKFLIDKGAEKIINHKRENIIPHTTFTDMGFKLVEYKEKEPEYKWNYELNTKEAINMWSQYEI